MFSDDVHFYLEMYTFQVCIRFEMRGVTFEMHSFNGNIPLLQVVSQSCPQLSSLTLSYCTGVTEKAFQSLAAHSPSLESINVQYSEVGGTHS